LNEGQGEDITVSKEGLNHYNQLDHVVVYGEQTLAGEDGAGSQEGRRQAHNASFNLFTNTNMGQGQRRQFQSGLPEVC
jgi:hypothetical protein